MSARERLLNAQVIREHGPMDGAEAAELDVLARAIEAEARELLLCALVESEKRAANEKSLRLRYQSVLRGIAEDRSVWSLANARAVARAALLEGEPDAV